jgi:hypothetical protein
MPRHKQVTDRDALAMCSVCGGVESTLTTDCPGSKHDRHQELHETNLDYTDARGWFLAQPATVVKRTPRFETADAPSEPPCPDPRAVVAPSINWAAVDRITNLKDVLAQKAIAWVLSDRIADDHSAKLGRLQDEVAAQLPQGQEPDEHAKELLKTLEYEKIGFHLANQHADKCDDEFRQVARRLVTALEEGQVVAVANDRMLFTRTCGCTVVAGTECPHFVAAHK